MRITGSCHCGNVKFDLEWPEEGPEIPVRECGCTFCRKHGGAWTSNRGGDLAVAVGDESLLSRYSFGTATAEFYVCARCGVVPVVVSAIEGRNYAVVNVNTFAGQDSMSLVRSPTNFDGEETTDRLARRKRNWIANVRISATSS